MKKAMLTLPLVCCMAAGMFVVTQPAWAEETAAPTAVTVVPSDYEAVAGQDYRIKEEDYLKLDVWGEPQLTNIQLLVTPDGKINVPYIGSIEARGMTQAELIAEIARRLEADGILANAKVQISVLSLHRSTVRVMGEVNRPGEVEFKDGDRVLDAIAGAGSYKEGAWLEKATLLHKSSNDPIPIDLKKMLAGDLTQNYELQKGDRIYIPSEDYANKIYVLGQVLRPSIYALKDNTTILDAITLAGGPTPRGSLRGAVVVRGDPDKPTRVPCNISRLIDKGDLTQNVLLQSGDVVMVPETSKPDWGKISGVLGTIMNLTYLRRYGLF